MENVAGTRTENHGRPIEELRHFRSQTLLAAEIVFPPLQTIEKQACNFSKVHARQE
jgi:hypothetical protein